MRDWALCAARGLNNCVARSVRGNMRRAGLPDRPADSQPAPPCAAAPVSPARPEPLAWWLAVAYGALVLLFIFIFSSALGLW